MATARADSEDEPGEDEEDDETGPGFDFGLAMGVVVAVITVWAFFFSPSRMIEVTLNSGPVVFDTYDVGNLGPIPYISGATLALGFASGVSFPFYSDDSDAGFEFDLALGLMVPTIAVVALLVGLALFFPVIHYLLAGDLITATIFLIVMAVIAAIVFSAWIVVVALFLIGLIYLAIPALAGVYGGSFLARGLGAIRP